MNIEEALKVLDKEVKRYWAFPASKDSSAKMIMAVETVNSWVQAVKDKMNAPLDDEY